MPQFTCTVCEEAFNIPAAALEKFPGWKPRYCREHSPNKKSGEAKATEKPGRKRARPKRRSSSPSREENLTRAQVLEKYTEGADTGVFTDGSSHPNPGPGGWGFVWVTKGEIQHEDHGAASGETTNNRMELTALIEAFRALPEDASVTVFSDSQLCVNTITQWAPKWEAAGWTRKSGPLKNLDLVKELLTLYRARPACSLEWMRAHDGSLWNEYADSLASAWRRSEV